MAVVDRERRYVALNDAAAHLYPVPRQQVIGSRVVSLPDKAWEELVRAGELYGDAVVHEFSESPMRVSYAAHVTHVAGRWLALFVLLSAHMEPEGEELIAGVGHRAAGTNTAEEARRTAISRSKALTPREREVLQRVALGRSTPQIAAELGVSPATIRSHVRNAMDKTGAHTRAQLVALVLGQGLSND